LNLDKSSRMPILFDVMLCKSIFWLLYLFSIHTIVVGLDVKNLHFIPAKSHNFAAHSSRFNKICL
ncbi:MAG: hypothetical protein QM288_01760, partial [Bacteroidota bacterium]|nr:hypothetical protein [Bacteroidota bacterium]